MQDMHRSTVFSDHVHQLLSSCFHLCAPYKFIYFSWMQCLLTLYWKRHRAHCIRSFEPHVKNMVSSNKYRNYPSVPVVRKGEVLYACTVDQILSQTQFKDRLKLVSSLIKMAFPRSAPVQHVCVWRQARNTLKYFIMQCILGRVF